MAKKIFGFLILILIFGSLFFYLSFLNTGNKNVNDRKITFLQDTPTTHNGQKISDILSDENFKKVGIDPNKYSTFGDFLKDFKTFSGVKIDPINENFSIGIKKENGNILYIPYRFLKNKDNFENKQNKNLAILDIYSAYKNGMVFAGSNSKSGEKIIFEDEKVHPETQELSKIFSSEVNVFSYIKSLELAEDLGKDKSELLSYLYDFTGNYELAKKQRVKDCIKYKDCDKVILKISGKVFDTDNTPVSGVKIEFLNDSKFHTLSKNDGTFSFNLSYSNFSHIRFKASEIGYSDGFYTLSLNDYFLPQKIKEINFDFKLQKSDSKISLNKSNQDKFKKGKYYIIQDKYSKYYIPFDGLYYLDDSKYENQDFSNLDFYTYEFTKWTNMNNLLENDTFEPVLGYVGNIMKTFGMPYIQIVDRETKKELFIKSSNPIILQNKVYHMKELYDNYDKIYDALTKDDMKFLVKKSKELGGYPINFDFLTKNNFLRWPARWALDRKTGIWSNVGCSILDEEGLVELPFYSVKDN